MKRHLLFSMLSITFFFSACQSFSAYQTAKQTSASQFEALINRSWILTHIGHEVVELPTHAQNIPSMRFDEKNLNYIGVDGCNRFVGTFTINQDKIRLNRGASTLLECDKEFPMRNRYRKALQKVVRFHISEDHHLTLFDQNDQPLVQFRERKKSRKLALPDLGFKHE